MKAYMFRRPGPAHRLQLAEVPAPSGPNRGEVLIQNTCIGVNYAEVLSRKGQYSWAPKRPYILGMEVCGRIVAVGEGVDTARIGQLVIAGMQYGAYAEQVVVPAHLAFPAFEQFSPEENAALLVNYMTAWVALFKLARAEPGETVLVQAAAGGVGTAAVQLLKAHGCRVVALSGGPEKMALCQRLGADLALDYRRVDFAEAVRTAGMRPDIVLELVGGDVFRSSYQLLRPFGRMVVAGYASIPLKIWNPFTWWPAWRDAPKAKIMDMARRSIGMYATHIGYLIQNEDLVHNTFGEMAAFIRHHGIRPIVGHVFPFQEMAKAHDLIETRGSTGKVVVRV